MQDGICSNFPNASPQELEKWTMVMSDKILLAAEDYRMYIDRSLKEMIKGSGVGDDDRTCRAIRPGEMLIIAFRHICRAFHQYDGRKDLKRRLHAIDGL